MKIILRNIPYRHHNAISIGKLKNQDLHLANGIECLSTPLETITIHGKSRQMITIALFSNYPFKLVAQGTGITILVEAPKKTFEILKALQKLKRPVRRDEDFYKLLKNPTLENVEKFIAVRKLMEK